MVEIHTFFLLKYHSSFKCRVLKRNYSIFFIKSFSNNKRNDAFSRFLKWPISLLDILRKNFCYFSNALYLDCELNVSFVTLVYPFGNVILNTVYKSPSNLIKVNFFSLETLNFCIARLNNIQFYKNSNKYINLTKDFLTDPSFLFLAYNQIKKKARKNIQAVDSEISSVINKKWFIYAANKIKNNKYKFKLFRRSNISKSNTIERRYFTIDSLKDKIIQQAIFMLLHHIYEVAEKIFFDTSRDSKTSWSPHTAIKEIKEKWTGLYWYLEININKAFDMYNRNIIINLLSKTISDQRLIDLIRKMFKIRILAPKNFYFRSDCKIPRSNILSPILSKIYLNELDKFMKQIVKKYKKGFNPTINMKYFKLINLSKYERTLNSFLQQNIKRYRRKKLFNQGIKPYLHDNNYIRVRYIRYIEDILIGVRGPKQIVKKIKSEFQNWLKSNLHLNLKEKKTKLTYILGKKLNFLGFVLYCLPYKQQFYRKSRKIEKRKRVIKRIKSYEKVTKTKLKKFLRTKITKLIAKKLGRTTKIEEKNHFTKELSESLIQLILRHNQL